MQPGDASNYRPHAKLQNDKDRCELEAEWQSAQAASYAVKWAKIQTLLGVLGFFGLIWTLVLTRKSTQAALDAVDAQIASDRPIMQMGTIEIKGFGELPFEDSKTLSINWWLNNFGGTGCWMEGIQLSFSGFDPSDERYTHGTENAINAFVPPEKGLGNGSSDLRTVFNDPIEFQAFLESRRLFIVGHSVYRDSGGRRWKTGFAGWLDAKEDWTGSGMALYPSEAHWFDERLPNKRKPRWYQRLKRKS